MKGYDGKVLSFFQSLNGRKVLVESMRKFTTSRVSDLPAVSHGEDIDVSQIPKTGVEYPFLLHRPQFINEHDEFEACIPPMSVSLLISSLYWLRSIKDVRRRDKPIQSSLRKWSMTALNPRPTIRRKRIRYPTYRRKTMSTFRGRISTTSQERTPT